jgi:hypothetical protein
MWKIQINFNMAFNKFLPAVLGLAILLLGCSKQQNQTAEIQPEEKIDGSAFIVTEGAENIKLGLVSVALFDEKQITPALLKIATTLAQTNLDTFIVNEKKIDGDENKFEDEKTTEMKAISEEQNKPGTSSEEFSSLEKRWLEIEHERDDETRQTRLKSERKDRIQNWIGDTFKIFVNNISVPVDTAKTDADGKFSFSIRKGSYLLAAIAERKVSDKTELYCWLAPVDFDGKPSKQAMLSNDNLINIQGIYEVVPFDQSSPVKFCFGDSTVELSNPYFRNRDQIIVLKEKTKQIQ